MRRRPTFFGRSLARKRSLPNHQDGFRIAAGQIAFVVVHTAAGEPSYESMISDLRALFDTYREGWAKCGWITTPNVFHSILF